MREILFRGKSVYNGEWIEGSYYHCCGTAYGSTFIVVNDFGFIEVIPHTVGQYTGLTDKNGKKIFEGDIVKNSRDVGLLYYKEKNSAFTVKGWEYGYWLWHDKKEDIEVIGNIYDNKDLLKED
jgi:uncharacterized phage protein (TIGR01671 family)